ncbi:Chromatin protein family [Artemisia annua]|uniref:Chromatin protein family n=1 Tax=Artemisia annua TaxID=35608 RepID=A0A2U1QLB4_ARTAN|nr:Chromatin protein family [Artemisia annua]
MKPVVLQEDYENGNDIRPLDFEHDFHTCCIEQLLTGNFLLLLAYCRKGLHKPLTIQEIDLKILVAILQVIGIWGSDMGTVVTSVSQKLKLHLLPVMHSPPRPVTMKDHQDWKIHPCISNRKNKVESLAEGSTDLRASISYKTITLKWVLKRFRSIDSPLCDVLGLITEIQRVLEAVGLCIFVKHVVAEAISLYWASIIYGLMVFEVTRSLLF